MSNELQHVSGSQHIHAGNTAAQPTGVQHAAGSMSYWPNGAATAQPSSHGNTPTPAAFIAAVQQSLQAAAAGPSNGVSVGFPSGVSTHGGGYVPSPSSLPPASQWRQLPPYVPSGENRAAAARPSPPPQQQQHLPAVQQQQHLPAVQQQEVCQHLPHAHQTMLQQVHVPPVKQPVQQPQLAQLQQASAPRGASPTAQQQQQGRQGLMQPPGPQGNAAQRPQLFLTQQQVMQILQFQQRQQMRQQQQQQAGLQQQQEQQRPPPVAAAPLAAASSGSAAAGQAFNQQEVLRQALAAAAAAAAGRTPVNNVAPPSLPAAAQAAAAAAAGPPAPGPMAGAGTYVGHATPYVKPTNRGAAACGSGGGGAGGGVGSVGHRTAGGAATQVQTHAKPAAVTAALPGLQPLQQQKQYEVHQGAPAAEQQQQHQGEGFSQEVLTLLTMIAATAVYGAAESEASGKPLAPAFNPRVLTAAKRFLSALVSIDDHTVHEEDEEQQTGPPAQHPSPTPEAMAAAAAATAAPATDEQLADAAAAAAAMALCSLPRESRGCDRSSSDAGGGYNEGLDEDRGPGQQGYRPQVGLQRVAARKRGRPRKSDVLTAPGYTGAAGRPPTGGRGGRGRRPVAGGRRSGLMALLQAVEEHDHYSTGAEDYDMDWAAAGAENDIDMEGEPEQLGRGGRRRRAAAKRPRYLEDSSSDSSSESCSIDSTGNRRYAADTEQELDSIALSPHRGSRHRLHASRRGTSEDLHPSSVLYSRAAAAAGVGATGHRNRGRGPSPAPPKKHRWVAGANQWVTDDGLVVWPKDTLVTPDQRVFYVAFKWVQQHWPHYVRTGQHVSEVPVTIYLDGEEAATAGIEFVAKIRIYNTAAHLVITPYSKLAGLFRGTFMAGYAFNPQTHSIRVYLSTEQPGAEPAVGRSLSQHPAGQSEGPPPALADSSAAAADDDDRLAAVPGPMHQVACAAGGAQYMQHQHVAGPAGARAESAAPADQASEEVQRAAKSAAGRAAVNVRWEKYRAQRRAQQSGRGATDGMTADESITLQQGQEGTAAAVDPVPLAAPAATNVTPVGPGATRLVAPAGTGAAAAAGWGVVPLGSASVSGLAGPPSGSSGEANAAGSSTPQWEQLEQQLGLSAAGGASAINNTVLCVSEALQLPDELLAKLPGQLLQGLNAGGADRTAQGAQGVKGAERQHLQAGVVPAAIMAWYQQLCGAVAARDSSQVTHLMQRLGSELLVAGQ